MSDRETYTDWAAYDQQQQQDSMEREREVVDALMRLSDKPGTLRDCLVIAQECGVKDRFYAAYFKRMQDELIAA